MDFKEYENKWIKHFESIHRRKPTKGEKVLFAVGFDAGVHWQQSLL